MLLLVYFACFLPSQSDQATFGIIANDNLEEALKQIDNSWNGSSVIYWKCALENKSSKTLYALGTTRQFGNLATPLPDILPGSTGAFVWEKSQGSATGASGVVHYQYGDKILNLMASIPYDWNSYSAYCNVRVSNSKESFYNLEQGQGGCAYPAKAGYWAEFDGASFFLTKYSPVEFKVYFNG